MGYRALVRGDRLLFHQLREVYTLTIIEKGANHLRSKILPPKERQIMYMNIQEKVQDVAMVFYSKGAISVFPIIYRCLVGSASTMSPG